MTRDHFFDLARQSYSENLKPDNSNIDPYKFVEFLPVWATELEESEIECVVRVIRKTSEKVGALWTQEFEAVLTGTGEDKSPQMWHFDGKYGNLAGVGVVCLKFQKPVRVGTELVKYPHKMLIDMTAADCYNHIRTVFARIKRDTAVTARQFDQCVKQSQVREGLTGENVIHSCKCAAGDLCVFYTDHLHRGASSSGEGYAYFCSWEIPEYRGHKHHTDGIPIQLTNWKQEYQKVLFSSTGNQMQLCQDSVVVAQINDRKDRAVRRSLMKAEEAV
jgi:hypothetical protein